MADLISGIFFEQLSWFIVTPIVLILLAMILWKKPDYLDSWQQQSKNSSKNTYYLPVATWLKQPDQQQSQTSKISQFINQYIKYSLFLLLILIALTQPYQLGQKLPEAPQQRDIVFLLDTSVTMSLKDYQVNGQRIERMAMLKTVLSHFIKNLNGNRISITVFSEQAYTLVPLTTDYLLLQTQLQRLESAVLTGRTSNPSKALLYTAKQYQGSKEKPVLVMLTDIDRPDRQIDPRAAASYLAKDGFHLHTIGIGAASQTAKTDDVSSLIYQPANFLLLQEIARQGNGKFFWAKDISSLNTALQHIQKAELRLIDSAPEYIKEPLYMWFVISALIWISFWQLLAIFRAQI